MFHTEGRWEGICVYGSINVKLSNSLNDGNTVNQHQCQVIIKDPEKTSCLPRGMDHSEHLLLQNEFNCGDFEALLMQYS